jgi:hypothetical protein
MGDGANQLATPTSGTFGHVCLYQNSVGHMHSSLNSLSPKERSSSTDSQGVIQNHRYGVSRMISFMLGFLHIKKNIINGFFSQSSIPCMTRSLDRKYSVCSQRIQYLPYLHLLIRRAIVLDSNPISSQNFIDFEKTLPFERISDK